MKQEKKTAIIVGAGPAGLTAAYELLARSGDVVPLVFELSDAIGGISRTVSHNGNRIDIGGHRFFSKNRRVADWWERLMPLQGAPAADDLLLGRLEGFSPQGPDPQVQDCTMLLRRRVSRIFYLRKFFNYPISLKLQTFRNMGLARTVGAGFGYLRSLMAKRPEKSLEDFYINRFGKPLYSMFFESYTRKVWGLHPSQLGADWGAQRVKGLSVTKVLSDVLGRALGLRNRRVETSLIEEFSYPKFGPGQLWEKVAAEVREQGGEIRMHTAVNHINIGADGKVESVDTVDASGRETRHACDYLISSMPLKELVEALRGVDVPEDVRKAASALPYRDFITVGLLVDKLKIGNSTRIATFKGRIPDTWIYIQEPDVHIGRLQVFNNWSPYMVADYENTLWLGLEFFCSEGDELWEMADDDFIAMATSELEKIGMIDACDVRDAVRIKVKKAYPAYHGSYYDLPKVRRFLDSIPNLFCVGRNGQHRYNNMDHSMLTAMETVDNILHGVASKSNIWAVNTEEEYHESK